MVKTAEKKNYDSRDDFSVLLGTRNVSAEKRRKEKAMPKKAEPVKIEAPPEQDFSKLDVKSLLRKKSEIEMFLSSIEDAHNNSKFPEYTYERLRKKCHTDTVQINREIKKRGYNSVKNEKEKVGQYIETVKESIDNAKKDEKKVITTEYKQEEHPDRNLLGEMSAKIDILSDKLNEVSKKLEERIDHVEVTDDVEITENVKVLKKEINTVKSSLSEYVRKGELEKIVLKPSFGIYDTPKKTAPPEEPHDRRVVFIEDLSEHVGKEVVVECSIELFKKLEKDEKKVYWYRIEDETDGGVLTSYNEIKVRKAKIVGDVKKTKSGSYYLMYKSLS